MANPRKFSEKIALHNQKQAEETAAFEAILRDVSAATQRTAFHRPNHLLPNQQNMMHQYRSLPNVNQISNSNSTGMELQGLQHTDGMRSGSQTRVDRIHPRDRGRQIGPLRSRPFQMEKSRADCSPYGSGAYLSPPPDTSWRRTNSDSAIHSSSSVGGSTGDVHSLNTPPMHRRIHEVVGENSGLAGDMLKGAPYPWDPKKLQQRPKSCEVPNINIYPSVEQDTNTGSLPDLTDLQIPSPLTTPLDVEDQQNYGSGGPANLSPNAHLNMGLTQHPNGSPHQSPGSQRRRMNPSGPSPLVLTGNGTQHLPLSPPVSSIDPTRMQMDQPFRQQFRLYMHQQQQRHGAPAPGHHSPSQSHNHHGLAESPRVPPPHMGPVPKVCVTSHENDPPEPSLTQYRNNINETSCQSPTSPHSQTSYSPSQSPGLPQQMWNHSGFDIDTYIQQQQQQANALQQQFEQINMIPDNQQHQVNNTVIETSKTSSSMVTLPNSSIQFSQANAQNLAGSQDFAQHPDFSQQHFYMENTSQSQLMNNQQGLQSTANNKYQDIIFPEGSFEADLFPDGISPLGLDGLQILTTPSIVTDDDTENLFREDHL